MRELPPAISGFSARWLVPRLGLAFVSLLLAIAVAELAARRLVSRPIVLRASQWRGVPGVSETNLAEAVDNDPDLFWRFLPNKRLPDSAFPLRGVISNGQGLREDHEIPREKKPGELRLLFLGDSNTFGWGLLHHESFVYQAESILRSTFPGARLECINAGVPGYTLFQGFRFLETRGFHFQPDLIVLDFGMNEGRYWDRLSDLEHGEAGRIFRSFPVLSGSRLCQMAGAVKNRWERREKANDPPRPRVLPEEFRLLLIQSHEAARQYGADLLLLVPPSRPSIAPDSPLDFRCPYQHELLSYGRSTLRLGVEQVDGVIDCVPIVRDMARENTALAIFSDRYHTTSPANARIAAAIAKKLVPWVRSRLAEKENSTSSALSAEEPVALGRPAGTNPAQRKAVAEIKKLGGEVTVDDKSPGRSVIGVNLSHTELTAAGLKCLKGLSDLHDLDLSYTKVTDTEAKYLEGLPHLQSLHLSCTNVTDAGLASLRGLTNLRSITLWHTEVTDAGLENLKGLTNLESLDLGAAKVTDAGLKHLEPLSNLQWLDLGATKVGDAGLEHLQRLARLQMLNLGGTKVTDAGLEYLQRLAKLQLLNLEGTEVIGTGLQYLHGLARLETLNLANSKVTDTGLKHLGELTQLQSLILLGTSVTDAGIEHLKDLTRLHELDLSDTQVTYEGANKLQLSREENRQRHPPRMAPGSRPVLP